MSSFKKTKIAIVVAAMLLTTGAAVPRALGQAAGEPGNITLVFSNTRGAIGWVLYNLQQFNMARSENNVEVMQAEADDLLVRLEEAVRWSDALDRVVVPGEHGENVDNAVADLNELLVTAYGNVESAIESNDIDAIKQRLDQSADAFNRLESNLRNLNVLLEEWV